MAKGGRFERNCARDITEWLTRWQEDEPRRDPPEVWRSTSSGGVEWEETLDLAPRGKLGMEFLSRFGIECKHRRDPVLWGLHTGREPPWLYEWWYQAVDESEKYGLCPMLLVQMKNKPLLVGHPSYLIPTDEHLFPRSLVVEEKQLRLVHWDDWIELPVQQLYELHDERFDPGSAGDEPGGSGS